MLAWVSTRGYPFASLRKEPVRAALDDKDVKLTDECREAENQIDSSQTKTASTRKGVGQALARKVRDGVMGARAQGFSIALTRGPNCCCPLGATLLLLGRARLASHPAASFFLCQLWREAGADLIPDEQMVWAFIAGFEEGVESRSHVDAIRASGRLGLEYRARYLKKKAARHDPRPRRQRLKLASTPPQALGYDPGSPEN